MKIKLSKQNIESIVSDPEKAQEAGVKAQRLPGISPLQP